MTFRKNNLTIVTMILCIYKTWDSESNPWTTLVAITWVQIRKYLFLWVHIKLS